MQGWSQSLGGEIFIDLHDVSGALDAAVVPVTYRSQDLVYPGDPSLPATLYCLQNCPTQATLQAYFTSADPNVPASPYLTSTYNNFNPTAVGSQVQYDVHADTAMVSGGDGSNANVSYTDAAAYSQRPQFANGVNSGRLFANLADSSCQDFGGNAAYCDWKVNDTDVYYQWQTGPNNWNQFTAVKNGAGELVPFDPPLQLSYHVPDSPAFGAYAHTNIVLQYGGYGDLWGIPGTCVSANTNEAVDCSTPDSRYVPAFVIPFDQTLGLAHSTDEANTPYLVKWLDREIRFARKTAGECDSLTLPLTVDLPTTDRVKNPTDPDSDIYIGVKPVVTDAPRVIHGEIKF